MAERMVGPVLAAGRLGEAVADALTVLTPDAVIEHRGGYLRVLAPERCTLTRRAVEQQLGDSFRLPNDLERVMASFRGRLVIGKEEARWE
jgi:hypothetical protein